MTFSTCEDVKLAEYINKMHDDGEDRERSTNRALPLSSNVPTAGFQIIDILFFRLMARCQEIDKRLS